MTEILKILSKFSDFELEMLDEDHHLDNFVQALLTLKV